MDDCKPPPTYEEIVNAAAVTPSAPYINEGFEPDPETLKTPTAPCAETPVIETPTLVNLGRLTEEDLREACFQYAAEHCCYGSRCVRDMYIGDIENSCTFHYKLESYGEKRQTMNKSEAYYGQSVDGPENGPVPDPWTMTVFSPKKFEDYRTVREIPHTAYVKECGNCVGNGRVRCDSCWGAGGESCWSCNGTGRDSDNETCFSCSGTGHKTCYRCDGRGQVKCSDCDGHGKLKHYRVLIVTWKNHGDDFISETVNLPKKLILKVGGRQIFKEEADEVSPLSHSPDRKVAEASSILLRKHATSFPNELIRMQRHVLRAVPLTRAVYKWKTKGGEFYVYGFQKKVYFEDYPQKCCCCTCL